MSMGRGSSSKRAAVALRGAVRASALTLLGLALMTVECSAHAHLRSPRSRVLALGLGGEYLAASGNGKGTAPGIQDPGVCGDPHQDLSKSLNMASQVSDVQDCECLAPSIEKSGVNCQGSC